MSWLTSLFTDPSSFSHGMLVYSFVIALGLSLGRIRVFGISLGTTWVLFLGLILSFLGLKVDPALLGFFKNFGLILFVFFIGLQVGPSFFATFRNGGWGLNGLMLLGIALSIAVTIAAYFLFGDGMSFADILGVHFGAVTSTPGLGATQEAIHVMGKPLDITVGYACAYPLAILGMIFTIVFLKKIFRVDIAEEDRKWEELQKRYAPAPIYYHVTVTNKAIDGKTMAVIAEIIGRPFICSRVLHEGVITSPTADFCVHFGDKLRIVSNKRDKTAVVMFLGEEAKDVDLATAHSPLVAETIRVTRRSMNGVRIEQLHLSHMDGVNITRVIRSGVQFLPYASLRLQMGDKLYCVGPRNSVARLANEMGNQAKYLDRPNVIAIFLGIFAGVVLGAVPIAIPGMPEPVKLGLAGGPLISAILLSHFGPRFHLVTYMTNSANLMLRTWGISFFLASVGLGAGVPFFDAFANGSGPKFVALGLLITLVPMMTIGVVARKLMHLNFHTIAGLIAGTSTNTAILAFAGTLSEKSTAVVAYSNIYPVAMFLRIITGQVLLVLFWQFV
ncbi:MAG: putative transporter [Sutterellaceae bacterium]|nr:putative transporter [Sutterellaceae bacterium]MDY2868670.1 putative transporter [Mesosutterella sp.]